MKARSTQYDRHPQHRHNNFTTINVLHNRFTAVNNLPQVQGNECAIVGGIFTTLVNGPPCSSANQRVK